MTHLLQSNKITKLLSIKYSIIQAGMVWVSGWKLASAVSNNGGLGLIGAGSMKPELLDFHIKRCFDATPNSFGVNLPLLRKDASDLLNIIIKNNVKIVFTSAGNPAKFIDILKQHKITVVHVVSNIKQGLKAQSVGCDAVVGEGVEAGGHNGVDEITTFCLIPSLARELEIPVIAAGGISTGSSIVAALALGAQGVQIGTRFAVTFESSAHEKYKHAICDAHDTSTTLILKKIGMARVIKNRFSESINREEDHGSNLEKIATLLGEKRERKGIFEGILDEGMIEASQSSAQIKNIQSVSEVFNLLLNDYKSSIKKFLN